MSGERLAADREGDVRAVCGIQQGSKMAHDVGRRGFVMHNLDPAHDDHRAIGDVELLEYASLYEPWPTPAINLAVDLWWINMLAPFTVR